MSQQIIDISTPDDGLGDVLRTGFDKTNQNFTELYNGKVDKVTGKGLSENDFTDADKTKLDGIEAGAQVNVNADFLETDPSAPGYILNIPPSLYSSVGFFDYNDLATQTTPLTLVANVSTKLTNDTLGSLTNISNPPYGVATIWNETNNEFDFSSLSVGDTIDLRVDLLINIVGISENVKMFLRLAKGSPSQYDLYFYEKTFENAGANPIQTYYGIYIRSDDDRNYPAELHIVGDNGGTVVVNGWYTRVIRKNVNIVTFNSDPLKLDKDTTAGVERAYIINADGSQGTKATSEFKDVLEFANLAAFPVTGESSKIYVALDTNLQYRWSGSAYVQIGGTTKKTENLFFQDAVGSTARTITADQKNMHQSRYLANASPYGVLGLTLGSGIPETGGVINLSVFSDTTVSQVTGNYTGKVKKIVFSYSRNVSESGSPTNLMIRVMSDSKYNYDMQLICETNFVSSSLAGNAENKVELPILSHLPLSAFSNIRWCVRTNNATAQQFGIIRLNVILEEI